MTSIKRNFPRLTAMLLACLFVLPAGFSNQAFAEEQIKSSALKNNETELNRPLPFTNDFSVTAEGEFAKDKAAEMLERYPELNANPYAILVEFQPVPMTKTYKNY